MPAKIGQVWRRFTTIPLRLNAIDAIKVRNTSDEIIVEIFYRTAFVDQFADDYDWSVRGSFSVPGQPMIALR